MDNETLAEFFHLHVGSHVLPYAFKDCIRLISQVFASVCDLVVGGDELKLKVEVEEEENKEEEEQPQHSRQSLLSDKEEKEEGEDESEAEQDVICGPDTSSPPELCPSEEEAPDAQPPPSSKPSSRASSLDSLG